MLPESQIKRAQEKGVLPPSEEFIREPGRFDVLDLMGGKIKKEEEDQEKGINNKNIIVRGVTQIAKYVYDTGIILGSALAKGSEEGKN